MPASVPPLSSLTKSRVKILLVDDSRENLVSLEAALEVLDEELVLANSGTEALRQLLDKDFAAILLDVKMPDLDGFETAELIRTRPASGRATPPSCFSPATRTKSISSAATISAPSISYSNRSSPKSSAAKSRSSSN